MFTAMLLMETPTGKWVFVGRVPATLAKAVYATEEAAANAAATGGYAIGDVIRNKVATENKYHLGDSMY